MFPSLSQSINYNNYRHSYISGDAVKIIKANNKKTYDYKIYVKLGENSKITSFQKNEDTKINEVKYVTPSYWASKHFSNNNNNNSSSSSVRQSYDCIMELSNNAKFVVTIVNAKVTSKCNLFFYVNSNNTNNIFNVDADMYNSFKLPLKTPLHNVKFCIFEKFNLEDNLKIINANQQFLSNNLNNVKNGQLISITKAGTILKNSINLPDSDIPTCPEQNITVYKVLYWSSQSEQNGPQIVSGSILVPENVSKNEILQTRNGATFQYNDNSIIWYSIVNNYNFDKMSIHNKSTLLFSGLGYIVVHADGFGLGASEGKVSGNSDFNCEVYPHVDILRAVRTILPLFSRIVSIEPLRIIYCGYSNGAIYGPSVVHHFVPGNNQNLSLDEASKFKYTRMILGGCPCITTDFFKTIQENPTNVLLTLEVFGLFAWTIAHSNSGIMMSRPSAYNEIIRPITIGDELGSGNSLDFKQQLGIFIKSNTLMHPPNPNDVYTPATTVLGDIRQIMNIDNAVLYGSELTNMHGWANPKLRFTNFPPIPVTMIYASGDQVVAPTVGNKQSSIFKKISNELKPRSLTISGDESAYTFDGPKYLDDYMGTGKVIGIPGNPSLSVTYPGANKTVTVNNEMNDKTQSAVKEIASLINNTTGNNYVRIKIKTGNSRGFDLLNSVNFGRASHGGNIITWMESTYYALQ